MTPWRPQPAAVRYTLPTLRWDRARPPARPAALPRRPTYLDQERVVVRIKERRAGLGVCLKLDEHLHANAPRARLRWSVRVRAAKARTASLVSESMYAIGEMPTSARSTRNAIGA